MPYGTRIMRDETRRERYTRGPIPPRLRFSRMNPPTLPKKGPSRDGIVARRSRAHNLAVKYINPLLAKLCRWSRRVCVGGREAEGDGPFHLRVHANLDSSTWWLAVKRPRYSPVPVYHPYRGTQKGASRNPFQK